MSLYTKDDVCKDCYNAVKCAECGAILQCTLFTEFPFNPIAGKCEYKKSILTIDEQEAVLRKELESNGNKVYNTTELQAKYEVLGFASGFVAVKDKTTGEKGSFDFTHIPRLYYNYVKS